MIETLGASACLALWVLAGTAMAFEAIDTK